MYLNLTHIFPCFGSHETPQIEISNAHDNSVWDLAWHPVGYLLSRYLQLLISEFSVLVYTVMIICLCVTIFIIYIYNELFKLPFQYVSLY
jgi:hypothetical protein